MKELNKENVTAVIGVSSNPDKWGYKIYSKLKESGFKVYPVNPKYDKIGEDKCYTDLKSLPEKPGLVITVVSPKVTESIVKSCHELGIKKIWMQPGSESDDAIKFCKDNGIDVVYNLCMVVDGLKEKFDD